MKKKLWIISILHAISWTNLHESRGSANNIKTIPFFLLKLTKMYYIVFQISPVLIKIGNYFNCRTLKRRKLSTQLLIFQSFPFVRVLLWLFTKNTTLKKKECTVRCRKEDLKCFFLLIIQKVLYWTRETISFRCF